MAKPDMSCARVQQYQSSDIGSAERHNERKNGSYDNINVEISRIPYNVHYKDTGGLSYIDKESADTIIGNCDSRIFLGGSEPTTLKELSEALGQETIDTYNTGESRGRDISHSLNYQKLGKKLLSVDELAVLDGSKCVLQLRGVRPFLSDKYDITKHPNYKYLSDYDKKNEFDVEKFLSTKLKVKPDEKYDVYEISA